MTEQVPLKISKVYKKYFTNSEKLFYLLEYIHANGGKIFYKNKEVFANDFGKDYIVLSEEDRPKDYILSKGTIKVIYGKGLWEITFNFKNG